MLIRLMIALAVLAASSLPSSATTIIQSLSAVQVDADSSPSDIRGNYFNPSLGTLNSVTARVIGTYQAYIFGELRSPQVLTSVLYSFNGFGGNNVVEGIAGRQYLSINPGSSLIVGQPFPIQLSFTFPNVSPFIDTYPGPTLIVGFVVETKFAAGDFPRNVGSDLSSFDGTLLLIYDYTPIPEPLSLAILATGLGCLAIARRYPDLPCSRA